MVFPGISAADSETLLIRPIETELADIDGLKKMTATAAENYAGVAIEFEFGWDKAKTMADVREAMNSAEALFPNGAEKYSINELNFSEFPIILLLVSLAFYVNIYEDLYTGYTNFYIYQKFHLECL